MIKLDDPLTLCQIDIALAASKGVDAFALNVGRDDWEPGQVANAYAAAHQLHTSFKLFLSFDMTSLQCLNAANASLLRDYVTNYTYHPNQLKVNGASFISTFSGESCTFANVTANATTVNQAWTTTLKKHMPPVYFVPSFFIDPATFKTYTVMDGAFNVSAGFDHQ